MVTVMQVELIRRTEAGTFFLSMCSDGGGGELLSEPGRKRMEFG